MININVRGSLHLMFCANLKETIKLREQWIGKNGEKALIESEQVSREKYDELFRKK